MQTNKERLINALQEPLESTFATYKTSALGLVDDQVEENRDAYGENVITKGQEDSMIKKIYESIINPFTVILLVIALVSFITNVWLAKPGEQDPTTSIIIVTLVLISGGIRFIQELRSDKATTNLSKMIVNTATVIRDGLEQELPIDDLVVGDLVKLSAGIISPALNFTRSPTTNSSIGNSCSRSSRITVAVLTIIFERLVVALSLRNSWTKRMPPDIKTTTTIMIEVVGSSWPGLASQTFVTREIKAITSKMIVKGLIMDS